LTSAFGRSVQSHRAYHLQQITKLKKAEFSAASEIFFSKKNVGSDFESSLNCHLSREQR